MKLKMKIKMCFGWTLKVGREELGTERDRGPWGLTPSVSPLFAQSQAWQWS